MHTSIRFFWIVIALLALAVSPVKAALYNFNMMSATPAPWFDRLELTYPVYPQGAEYGVACVVFDDLDGDGGVVDGCADNLGVLHYTFPDGILDGIFSIDLFALGDAIVGTPYAIGYRDDVATARIVGQAVVTEPDARLLLGIAGAALLWHRRRRR